MNVLSEQFHQLLASLCIRICIPLNRQAGTHKKQRWGMHRFPYVKSGAFPTEDSFLHVIYSE